MSLVLNSTGGGSVTIQEPTTASNVTQTLVATTGTLAPLVLATAQATTSGTSIDFTGIPSWVERVTILFNGVSINGTSGMLVQLGSTTIQTSGYLSTAMDVSNTGTGILSSTAGIPIRFFTAAYGIIGSLTISNVDGNTWIASGVVGRTTQDSNQMLAGNVTLSGVLDRMRITTVNGTNAFDAGSINIMYEQEQQ